MIDTIPDDNWFALDKGKDFIYYEVECNQCVVKTQVKCIKDATKMYFQDYINKDEAKAMITVSPNEHYVNLLPQENKAENSIPHYTPRRGIKHSTFLVSGMMRGQNRGKKALKWEIRKSPKME